MSTNKKTRINIQKLNTLRQPKKNHFEIHKLIYFIDHKKALNRVKHDTIFEILESRGLHSKDLKIINDCVPQSKDDN